MTRTVALVPAAAVLAVSAALLAGCSGSGSGGPDRTGRTTAPPASAARSAGTPAPAAAASASVSSSPASPERVVTASSVPASVPNASGVITGKLVALTGCRATARGWEARGTARARAGKAAAYTVTVFFTTERATVQAFGHTRVTVPKGGTARWTVTSTFKAAPSTLCVLRGAG